MDRMYYSSDNVETNPEDFDNLCYLLKAYIDSTTKISHLIISPEINKEKKQFYKVSKIWLSKLKKSLGFDDVVTELKNRKLDTFTVEDFIWVKPIIEKNMKKSQDKKLDTSTLVFQKDLAENSMNSIEFDILDIPIFDSLNISLFNIFKEKVNVVEGKRKIIIQKDKNNYLIRYLSEKNNNSYREMFLKTNFEFMYHQEILNDILNYDILEWFKKIGCQDNIPEILEKNSYSYKYNVKEYELEIIINKEIFKLLGYEDDSDEFSSFYEKSFPKKIVQKIEKSSYIIATMQSLSQIIPFSTYFFSNSTTNSIQKLVSSTNDKYFGILNEFRIYMINLWKNEEEEVFTPKDFMKKLRKISNKKFNFSEELEPYEFYDYILKQLNLELNGIDSKMKVNLEIDVKNYNQNDKLKKYYNQIIKDNSSIIFKILYGIFKKTSFCNKCKQKDINYETFNLIDINIYEYYNYKKSKDKEPSKSFFLDDCLNYYFENQKEYSICNKCNKKADKSITKKIVGIPNYLIIRINWGQFKNDNGFICKDGINPSYQNLENTEIIEIKKENFDEDYTFNDNKKIENNINYRLFSTVDYFQKQNIFLSKCRMREKEKSNNWYIFWCNSKGKEKREYTDEFSSPCLLFYEKI